jgi:hypothetical protein
MANAKTKTLGTLEASKARKLPGFADYEKSAKALMEARRATSAAKARVKVAMKTKLKKALDDAGVPDATLDFTVETNGTVRIFLDLLEKKARTSSVPDLSGEI